MTYRVERVFELEELAPPSARGVLSVVCARWRVSVRGMGSRGMLSVVCPRCTVSPRVSVPSILSPRTSLSANSLCFAVRLMSLCDFTRIDLMYLVMRAVTTEREGEPCLGLNTDVTTLGPVAVF